MTSVNTFLNISYPLGINLGHHFLHLHNSTIVFVKDMLTCSVKPLHVWGPSLRIGRDHLSKSHNFESVEPNDVFRAGHFLGHSGFTILGIPGINILNNQ